MLPIFMKAPMLWVAVMAVGLFGAAVVRGFIVHQQVLSVQTEVNVSPSPTPEPTGAPQRLTIKPSLTPTPNPSAATPKPSMNAQGTAGCGDNTTKVTVNGKDIPVGPDGNVSYSESNGGSNVNVKINNGCNQQSSSKAPTSINNSVRVNTNTSQ